MITRWMTRKAMRAADVRMTTGKVLRNQLNKIFPDHWSFMLGELALYSFVILVITGTFLALFYNDSTHDIVYKGPYKPLDGVEMSEAYASVVNISFAVRAGLLIRQIHHWAALIFVAAIVVHMCRIFFTGAFRKPRDVNWTIGVTLLLVTLVEGFCGYSLPDDLLSGTGVRIAYSIVESVPLVGGYFAVWLWDGQYPGSGLFFPRLFMAHIFVLPALLAVLITIHLVIIWHQKHTDFKQPGRTEKNVIGSRLWPTYSLKAQGLFFMTFGFMALLGAYAQINPIWLYGPYDPATVSAGAQPDWYVTWLEGALRLMTGVESDLPHNTVVWNVFLPAVFLPVMLFIGAYLYPFVERRLTHDHGSHELLQRPSDTPYRTAIGSATIAFLIVLLAAGSNDVIAKTFKWNLIQEDWAYRALAIFLPPIVFFVVLRLCRRIQRVAKARQPEPDSNYVIRPLPGGGYGLRDTKHEPRPHEAAHTDSRSAQ